MIKTPLSTTIGGVGFYTKNAVVIGGGHKPEPPFDIASLFENGEQGLFYDPHTLDNSLVGQTVPTVPDLSGNNNHGSNANSAQQMLLEVDAVTGYKYLEADGVDDGIIVPKQNFKFLHDGTGSTVIAAYTTDNSAKYHTIMSSGLLGAATNTGYTLAQDNRDASTKRVLNIIANGSGTLHLSTSAVSNSLAKVATTLNKNGLHVIRENAVEKNRALTEVGTASDQLSTYDLYIGKTSTNINPFSGRIYALLIIDRILTDVEIQKVEAEFAKRMGITL